MCNFSKKSLVLFLVLAAVATATGWFLVREARKTGEALDKIGFVPVQIFKKPASDTDLVDTSKWQLAETDNFFVRFPHTWFWKQNPNGMPNNQIITNNRHFDLLKYPEIGILDYVVDIENTSDFVISFYGWPTAQPDNPTDSTEKIIENRIRQDMEYVRQYNDPSAQCNRLQDKKVPYVFVCSYVGENSQAFRKYFIVNRQQTILLRVQKREKNNSISNEVFDEIAKGVSLKEVKP